MRRAIHHASSTAIPAAFLFLLGAGCQPPASPANAPRAPAGVPPIAPPAPAVTSTREPAVSWDTDRDRQFAQFLRQNSGGMIAKAAVGIEREGVLRIQLDSSVAPEDTLNLTKSILAGARKDFPDRPITLALYDPNGKPILKASQRPGAGVRYQIAHETGQGGGREASEGARDGDRAATADPLSSGGVTERDRRFARWAEDKGSDFLRYVEADLDRHGRLWFGVTRNVAPDDVRSLAQSLLEGARTEFPDRELRATVFDPDGQRIGTARLDRRGRVDWER